MPNPLNSIIRTATNLDAGSNFYDRQVDQRTNQPYIVNLDTLEKMFFQNIPEELEYELEGNWAVIAAPGRNIPLYHYTGGENTLPINLSFYSTHEKRTDVLWKCKWLQSLAVNDGYMNKPPKISIVFGDLFKDSIWVLQSVKPRYRMFSREHGMLPQQATVELVFKKVATLNIRRNDVLKITT